MKNNKNLPPTGTKKQPIPIKKKIPLDLLAKFRPVTIEERRREAVDSNPSVNWETTSSKVTFKASRPFVAASIQHINIINNERTYMADNNNIPERSLRERYEQLVSQTGRLDPLPSLDASTTASTSTISSSDIRRYWDQYLEATTDMSRPAYREPQPPTFSRQEITAFEYAERERRRLEQIEMERSAQEHDRRVREYFERTQRHASYPPQPGPGIVPSMWSERVGPSISGSAVLSGGPEVRLNKAPKVTAAELLKELEDNGEKVLDYLLSAMLSKLEVSTELEFDGSTVYSKTTVSAQLSDGSIKEAQYTGGQINIKE